MDKYIHLLYHDKEDEFKKIPNPLERKKTLGTTIVADYYSKSLADSSRKDFEGKFSEKSFPDDILEIEIQLLDQNLLDLLEEISKKTFSRSELKRLIKDKAIEINEEKLTSLDVLPDKQTRWKIKIGKRNFYKAKFI